MSCVVRSSSIGDFAGTSFTVAFVPESNVISYFLPKSVKLTLKGVGADSLAVAGFFDDGGVVADFTRPVTIEVGGFSQTFTLAAAGAG